MATPTTNTYDLDRVLSPHARDALRHLELFARRTVQGWQHGLHRSKRLGVSTEFDHHKNYQPGDPLKHLDWKVSARHDRYYVKRYIEDTALTVRLVVDRSASMLREHEGTSKYLQASRVAASLAYLIINHGDSAGMALAESNQTMWLPAGSTQRHLMRMLQALVTQDAGAADALEACLRATVDRSANRGLVVLVSDLMFDPAPVQRELARLAAQGQEVLIFQVRDPAEEEFPFNRWAVFQNLENPAMRHKVDAVVLQRIYREEYQSLLAEWRKWAKKQNVHYVTFRTDERVEQVLSQYMAVRSEMLRS